ncbi:zinc ABC transporter substrate-binding protein [Minwuia sp.]|uniref:zinc ABC transporter substrate-binding protein n=1 Tax=Minwuia sp. TaxID=2493630 RepID=UPI003A92B4B4
MTRLLAAAAVAALTAVTGISASHAAPRVAASIQPVHALVASVMGDLGDPYLLVPPGASPHDHALKPSDARALSQADVVFWVGPRISTFLDKALTELADDAQIVRLGDEPGLHLLPLREGGAFEPHAHDHGGHESEKHGHDHDDEKHGHEGEKHGHDHDDEKKHAHGDEAGEAAHTEAHIWLETGNAVIMTQAIAQKLAAVDPANADTYRANAQATVARLQALSSELKQLLEPVRGRPFIVFHDAWQHFEHEFGLTAVGSITVSPETPPGVRRMSRLRSGIRDLGVVCIFAEPQFGDSLPRTLADGTDARVGVADPLGAAYPSGPNQYEQLMRGAARAFRECLG